jgi:hypothetical protein
MEVKMKRKVLLTSTLLLAAGLAQADGNNSKFTNYAKNIHFGGSVRFSAGVADKSKGEKERLGDAGFNLFQFNVKGQIQGFILDAQWRRYNDFETIQHAWIGYDLNKNNRLKVGVTKTPFGIMPYSYNSYWGDLNYYLGYTDSHATGVKLEQHLGAWDLDYGFYKNSAYNDPERLARYSFHTVENNREVNQLNFRAARHFKLADDFTMVLGGSVQGGQLYNENTQAKGTHWAAAAHMNADWGPWNMRLQALHYRYNPKNEPGVSRNFIYKGGFNTKLKMPTKAEVYTVGLARSFKVDKGVVNSFKLYNDFNYMTPHVQGSSEAMQNIVGVSVASGPVHTYIEWVSGKNTASTNDTIAGKNSKWGSRLNINIGYYF